MIQYNIYAGLKSPYEGASYQYTSLYESENEALADAYRLVCDYYDLYDVSKNYSEIMGEYCEKNNIFEDNLVESDIVNIDILYNEEVHKLADFYVVKTEEDNIDENDLILDYDDSWEANS